MFSYSLTSIYRLISYLNKLSKFPEASYQMSVIIIDRITNYHPAVLPSNKLWNIKWCYPLYTCQPHFLSMLILRVFEILCLVNPRLALNLFCGQRKPFKSPHASINLKKFRWQKEHCLKFAFCLLIQSPFINFKSAYHV